MAETLVSMVTGPPRGRKDTLRQNHPVAEADSCLELWDQSRFHCRSCDRRQRWDRIHQCLIETKHFPYLFQTFVVMVTVINMVSGLRAGLPTCVAMVTLITVMAWMKWGPLPISWTDGVRASWVATGEQKQQTSAVEWNTERSKVNNQQINIWVEFLLFWERDFLNFSTCFIYEELLPLHLASNEPITC